ncbi:MAG: FtsK/SpoIIIE family DNA translocase [Armatimonadota bacterium]
MGKTRRKSDNDSLVQDVAGIISLALGAVLFIGIVSPESGWFGSIFGGGLRLLAGLGAFVVPFCLAAVGWVMLVGAERPATRKQLAGIALLFLVIAAWCQFSRTGNISAMYQHWGVDPDAFTRDLRQGGGWLGFLFAFLLEGVFGRISSFVILFALAVISLLLVTRASAVSVLEAASSLIRSLRPRQRVRVDERRTAEKPSLEKPKELLSALRLKRDEAVEPKPDLIRGSVIVRSGNGSPKPAPTPRPPVQHGDSEFHLPPITLLQEPPPPPKRVQSELNHKINRIEQTLEEFKIESNVVEISHGPTITRYEIQLAPGIKVNKIVNLADNLAMSLAAIDVRIEAPIPGKSAIGVEVPNDNPAVVTLREVIDTPEFWNAPSKLTFALGMDVAGTPRFADLTKMPHMLIAGATNAGKSVCLNALISSLLYRATPRELKFILIDPKRVELSLFDGIPHLCSPVVRDVKQAAGILRSVLKEMERRYDLFVKLGTRNFDGYNAKVKPEERLYYLVVVVDELADLMMQAGPEVEFSICRLAQLARATGIHLVIATQRPSVDVITGTIKANISSRISFAVSSQIDSRTILDGGGAERLIGRGDMLFKPIDASKPTRVQGCLITEKETEELVKFLKEQESPDYTMEPVQIGEVGGPGGGGDDCLSDEMYEPAVRMVVTSGYASTSMIQRRFKIGYTRAARLVDAMEEQGIVGPLDGAKPREVLIGKEDLDRLFGGILPEVMESEEEEY